MLVEDLLMIRKLKQGIGYLRLIRTESQKEVYVNFIFSLETEVWDFETAERRLIEPALYGYNNGIALFVVDAEFCKT